MQQKMSAASEAHRNSLNKSGMKIRLLQLKLPLEDVNKPDSQQGTASREADRAYRSEWTEGGS